MRVDPFPVAVLFAGLGACVGSFLNVVVYRLPRGLGVARPRRSFCPRCRATIPWYRNLPIVTWVVQNGRCASCGAGIPVRYVFVEAAGALLFFAFAWMHVERAQASGGVPAALPLLLDLWLGSLFLAIAAVDFEHALIPDPLTVPWIPLTALAVGAAPSALHGRALDLSAGGGVPAALVLALAGFALGVLPALFFDLLSREREVVEPGDAVPSALPAADEAFSLAEEFREFLLPVFVPGAAAAALAALVPSAWIGAHEGVSAAAASLAGAGAGLLIVYGVRALFSVLFAREAMGLGDAKFLALAGAALGAEGAALTFLLGCALGALPAIFSLARRLPGAVLLLVAGAVLPFFLVEPLVLRLGPTLALPLLSLPPLLALIWFLRRMRRGDVPLHALPFGPFLVLAALSLLLFAPPGGDLLSAVFARIGPR